MTTENAASAQVEAQSEEQPEAIQFGIDRVKELIPHRYPFLMVDKVTELIPGSSIVAVKNVSVNEAFFNGHFPDRPVFPGVMMIEALAQSAGILAKSSPGYEPSEGCEYFLVGASDVKWRRQVEPGDVLLLETKLVKKKRQFLTVFGKASVDGELAASANIQAAEVKV